MNEKEFEGFLFIFVVVVFVFDLEGRLTWKKTVVS